GASKWQQFWQITLPLLRPALLVALIFRTMATFRVFDMIYVLKGYATETMSVAVYTHREVIASQKVGYGSASAVVIFLIIGLMVLGYTRLIRVEEGEHGNHNDQERGRVRLPDAPDQDLAGRAGQDPQLLPAEIELQPGTSRRTRRVLAPDRHDPPLYALPVLLDDRRFPEDYAGGRPHATDLLARKPGVGELPDGSRERYVPEVPPKLHDRLG